jgi:hypothetical membrane protein
MTGAWFWLFCFQFFICEQIARLGWPGPYSMTRNYISDLGSQHCALHSVMNGSFVLQGVLIVLGAVRIREIFPPRFLYRSALSLFVVSGLGVLVVGLFAEDSGLDIHLLGAVMHFLAGNVAMILLGLAMIRRAVCLPGDRWKSWITFTAGSVGLLATLSLAFRDTPSWTALGWQTGLVERLAAYPLPLWLTWTGFRLRKNVVGRER